MEVRTSEDGGYYNIEQGKQNITHGLTDTHFQNETVYN